MKKVSVAVLGAGNRGREAYGKYIKNHPEEITAVAAAEPDSKKRRIFAEEHNIPYKNRFTDWQELLDKEKLADGIIISTLDNMHLAPACRAMEKGYKILLEKPIAPDLEDTLKIVEKAGETGSEVLVAHVLRYTNFFQKLKEILDEGIIGRIRLIDHIENIGYFHFAHSYVRGNWRNTDTAAPIILAKSCHDMDIIHWLTGKKCLSLSSRASLEYFRTESRPKNAANRCLDCPLKNSCPYSAVRIYLGENTGWPTSVITTDLSYQGRYQALKEGPYGRCVFNCDNNVPDVQTVNMTLENNIEVNFALTAFSAEINRTIKFFGTDGEIRADFENNLIEILYFNKNREIIKIPPAAGGHGGGDSGLMEHFIKLLKGQKQQHYTTSIEASLESHLMAFAAEKSRQENRIINLNKWRNNNYFNLQ